MIRAALVGLGGIAWKYDANHPSSSFALTQGGAMREHPDIELVGGCSPDAEDRNAFAVWSDGLPTYSSLKSMLEHLQPQMVGICSPTDCHFLHATQCLNAGVNLLWLEKPPTATLDELRQLMRISQKSNAYVCVNYFRRYLPSYQYARRIVQEKLYGLCNSLRITYSPGLARNGVHLLDQIFFITNAKQYKLLWVENDGDKESPSFALRLSTGHLVLVCSAGLQYHTNDISLLCEHGIVTIAKGGKNTVLETCCENSIFPGYYELEQQLDPQWGKEGIAMYMRYALDDLVISAKNHSELQSNLTSAYLTQQLMDDVLRGAA